jgi:DNA-binding IclR family transcriptional regulator
MNRVHQIPVLRKAIQVMNALADGRCEPATAALSRALGIAPATCYRIIQTFADAGWLRLDPGGRCELGAGLFPLLHRLQQEDLLNPRMLDVLRELTDATGVTSKVSVRDGDDALTLLRVDSAEPMALSVRPGARFHLTLGASGSILLSALSGKDVDKIIRRAPKECWQWQKPADVLRRVQVARQKGTVTDSGTYRPDIFGIAAALRDAHGEVHAALTLTGLIHGRTKAQLGEFRDLVECAAAKLNQENKLKKP